MESDKPVLSGLSDTALRRIYREDTIPNRRDSIEDIISTHAELFGGSPMVLSVPGRTEIGGNHTDHQRGRVTAASVDIDIVAAASAGEHNIVKVYSKGHEPSIIDISSLDIVQAERHNSAALIRGCLRYLKSSGYEIGGFNAYAVNNVPAGSGLSSSAAFEGMIGFIVSHLFNGGAIPPVEIAKAGKFAENEYYGKPCGLMDQLACAHGGMLHIDFGDAENPRIEPVEFDFEKSEHDICIINTGGSHVGLDGEYAAITVEMRKVAKLFGREVLSEVDTDEFFSRLGEVRQYAGDRAALRAMHFFEDSNRARLEAEALKSGDFPLFLEHINRSGISSWTMLQNIAPAGSVENQPVAVALAYAGRLLGGRGACRVHGGGFAGTIQVFVPRDMTADFTRKIEELTGRGSCMKLSVRPYGGIRLL